MELKNLVKIFEILIIVAVFTLIGFKGIGSLYDHKIVHEHPCGYLAADAFQHYVRALGAYQEQNYIYTYPYLNAGVKNITGHFSPISVVSPGHVSYFSRIPVHDTLLLNAGIIFALIAVSAYFIIRNINKNIALLALPLTLLIIIEKQFSPVSWGIMGFVYGYFFLLLFCWSLPNLFKEGYGFIFIGITVAGIIMAHGNQIMFAGLIAGLYVLFKIIQKRKIEKQLIKRAEIIILIIILLAGYSFLLQYISCKGGGMSLYTLGKPVLSIWNIPNVHFSDFSWWILILSALGVIYLLYRKEYEVSLLFLGLFILGLINYIGVAYPAFQQRFFWPIALSLFFGAGIFAIVSSVKLQKYTIIISIILIILFAWRYPSQTAQAGIMDDYHWDAFQQIKLNTAKDSEILIPNLYPYTQASIKYLFERMQYENRDLDLMYEWAVKIASNQTVEDRTIYTSMGAESTCRFPTRTGLLSIVWNNLSVTESHPRDFCSFDYYILDKMVYAQQDENHVKSLYIITKTMFDKEWIDVFYENDYIVILQNKDKTRDCINE